MLATIRDDTKKCTPYAAHNPKFHYNDVITGAIASQITSLTIVYSTVYSDTDQGKHQSSASLAFVPGIHRTGEFPAQMASNAQNVSIWWRHHVKRCGYSDIPGGDHKKIKGPSHMVEGGRRLEKAHNLQQLKIHGLIQWYENDVNSRICAYAMWTRAYAVIWAHVMLMRACTHANVCICMSEFVHKHCWLWECVHGWGIYARPVLYVLLAKRCVKICFVCAKLT